MTRSARILFFAAFCCFGTVAAAQSLQPTPAQIQQFKSMSPQQQRQLAESMGIDIDSLIGQQLQQQPGALAPKGEDATGQPGQQQEQFEKQLIPDDDRQDLVELYHTLSQEEFNRLFEQQFKYFPRKDFLDLYKEITGQKFIDKEEFRSFGYDLFTSNPDAFTPITAGPVTADYVLGPDDTLIVQLYGKENTTHHLIVTREGDVQFPNIGPISVAGLTFTQAQDVINTIISEQMIGVRSSITMGVLRTIRVFVLGEAMQPGSYTVSALSTVTNALFASGGITRVGSLRNIQLKRQGKTVTTLDVYDLLLHGDTSDDKRLLPGDVIFIPTVGDTVAVKGEVKRPAIYELKGEASAAAIVDLAGGLTSLAHPQLTRVERLNGTGEKSLITLDLSTSKDRNFQIRNADVIEIASTLETIEGAITLEGHVKRPGAYAWHDDLRFSDLVGSVDSLKVNPDLNAALIKREMPATKQIEILIFSPKAAWLNPGQEADPLLHKNDTLFIFDYTTSRPTVLADILDKLQIQSHYQDRQKTVTVAGSVRFPGQYPLAHDMTTDELIALAGGLTESALGTEAELTRYSVDENLKRVVVHVPVDLQGPKETLLPGDTLRIKQIPLWQEKETVEITGEVLFPGIYSILPGETLSQVLVRAGGLTPHAYSEGAVFSREDLRLLEQKRLDDLQAKLEADIAASNIQEDQTGKIEEAEATRLLSNLDSVDAVGRMVIDLPRILDKPMAYDFQLEDGDTLTIPRYQPSVTVVGEVQYPTSHFFDNSLDVFEYISRSGGTKPNADSERIYIVKANGQVVLPQRSAWFNRGSDDIDPGDTIVVPIDTDRVDRLTMWSSVTQIMYQAALGIAAISSL
jgi:polysaccharide export outer membrane protein